MAAPPSGPNRGQLLRAITLTTAEILTTHARHVHATERLAAESATKSDALASIAAAEEELAVLEAQRKFESENDAELSALQRANAAMTIRKQELVRVTKLARGERDRAREEHLTAYYARLGAALEAERLSASPRAATIAVSADMGAWPPALAGLYADVDAAWKRVSTAAVAVRDYVDAALAARGVALVEGGGGGGGGGAGGGNGGDALSDLMDARASAAGGAPSDSGGALLASLVDEDLGAAAVAASSIYATLGAGRLLRDAAASVVALHALQSDCAALGARCTRVHDSIMESGGSDGAAAAEPAVGAVHQLLALVEQNVTLQLGLLAAVTGDAGDDDADAAIVAAAVADDVDDGGGEGARDEAPGAGGEAGSL